jgi:hypothetical protein
MNRRPIKLRAPFRRYAGGVIPTFDELAALDERVRDFVDRFFDDENGEIGLAVSDACRRYVAESAELPPKGDVIEDLEGALRALDVAYARVLNLPPGPRALATGQRVEAFTEGDGTLARDAMAEAVGKRHSFLRETRRFRTEVENALRAAQARQRTTKPSRAPFYRLILAADQIFRRHALDDDWPPGDRNAFVVGVAGLVGEQLDEADVSQRLRDAGKSQATND